MSENMEEQEPSAQSPASEAQETENHAPRVARSASAPSRCVPMKVRSNRCRARAVVVRLVHAA